MGKGDNNTKYSVLSVVVPGRRNIDPSARSDRDPRPDGAAESWSAVLQSQAEAAGELGQLSRPCALEVEELPR